MDDSMAPPRWHPRVDSPPGGRKSKSRPPALPPGLSPLGLCREDCVAMLTCMPQTPRLPPPAAAATAARWPQAARSLCVCLAHSPVEGDAVRSATPPTTARPTPELRATLQALRERKRERQMTSFYSAPTGAFHVRLPGCALLPDSRLARLPCRGGAEATADGGGEAGRGMWRRRSTAFDDAPLSDWHLLLFPSFPRACGTLKLCSCARA